MKDSITPGNPEPVTVRDFFVTKIYNSLSSVFTINMNLRLNREPITEFITKHATILKKTQTKNRFIMANLTKDSKVILNLMKNVEVQSLNYEGCVAINSKGEVYMGGNKVDVLNTNEKIEDLWTEYIEGEGLY